MSIEAMKQGLEALEVEDMACRYEKEATPEYIAKAITSLRQAIAEAEGQEKALQALHAENERLGLYEDAYGKPEQCTYPDCPYPCMDLPDCIDQETVADAEAFRLMVDLNLFVFHGWTYAKGEDVPLANVVVDNAEQTIASGEIKGDDPKAATRRAIVRAAAQIGKAKEQ